MRAEDGEVLGKKFVVRPPAAFGFFGQTGKQVQFGRKNSDDAVTELAVERVQVRLNGLACAREFHPRDESHVLEDWVPAHPGKNIMSLLNSATAIENRPIGEKDAWIVVPFEQTFHIETAQHLDAGVGDAAPLGIGEGPFHGVEIAAGGRHLRAFEAVYEERYQERYGFWRPIIGTVVGEFLECGDLKQGFARVRCPKCREEFLVAYSCRVRCFCP